MKMTDDRDMMRNLLREAAGPAPDPAPSRRALRAALADGLARRRRRDRRVRVAGTLALTALLVAILTTPLGSDDFDTKVSQRQKAGEDWKVFSQGLRGDQVWVRKEGANSSISDSIAGQILQQRLSGSAVLVGLSGWRIGSRQHLFYTYEYVIGGKFISESGKVPGYTEKFPAWLKAYAGPDPTDFIAAGLGCRKRTPDLTVPMFVGGLSWTVQGWKFNLPGKEEVIYFRGERDDGVRSQDPEGF